MGKMAGVDGCRGGWAVCYREAGETSFTIVDSFAGVLALGFQRIAVDMPIGLAALGEKRTCDTLARKRLGRRASCVFPAPPRELLGALEYEQVRIHGLSIQSFHLLKKIREIDAVMDSTLQKRVFETHPELVFQRLNGGTVLTSKKNEEGLQQRAQLLNLEGLRSPFPRKLCSLDDLFDAAALLRAAEDWPKLPFRLPESPERDARGLRMEICY